MKAVVLATAFFLAYGLLITLIFRSIRPVARVAWMTGLFLASLPFLVAFHLATPADLGFLPDAAVEQYQALDLAFAVFLYSASFFGGWLQLYNLADRGLSLCILVDASRTRNGIVSAGTVVRDYCEGKGLQWMYAKRLDGLLRLGLLRPDGATVALTDKGLRYANVLRRLRALYRLNPR